jgi:peptidoglycan hydrolase CwlO-like protein
MNELGEVLSELKEIHKEISDLRDEIRNFLGFFELNEDEVKKLKTDIDDYKANKLETLNVEDVKKELNL